MGVTDRLGIGARVLLASNQSIPNGTWTPISWTSEDFDDAAFWDAGSPTVFTIPSSGVHVVSVSGSFNTGSGGAFRVCRLRRTTGGTTTDLATGGIGGVNFVAGAAVRFFAIGSTRFLAGDTVAAEVYQDKGSALDLLAADVPNFAIAKV